MALFDSRWQSCQAGERDSACEAFQPIFSSPPLSPPQNHRCRRWVGEESGEQEEEEQGAALEQELARSGGKGGKGSSYFFTLANLTPSFGTVRHGLITFFFMRLIPVMEDESLVLL